ncbi:ABC-type multidrug transport system fused ATPase/permease subunit [Hamadaea flava]|uniref:ABC transporter ATP-binding protein n=1 Tax=Hamadaea flava TaxID=1742688 RepID=A0ABV8M0D4_9ACTN|nr:ABC transporter ATP-binding protein [Hamadaea flava]MCP2326928.1 ABC-type multidrug transport system fused ATPase/permease subunit [Hamadaea flava]
MPPRLPHPDPGVPDTRSPIRYLWWLVTAQKARVLRGSVVGTLWMVGLSVRPYLIARAIDDGLRTGDTEALLFWVGTIVLAGMVLAWLGITRHRTMTFIREDATARSAQVLLKHITRVGSVLPKKITSGEVATVGGTDITQISWALTMTGPGVGAVLAYAVAAVVLWSVNPMLALFVLLGVPVVAAFVWPLLSKLQGVDSSYRHELGILTARAGDIVSGLRVLAGVGGRDLFLRRYAERSQTLLDKGYRVGSIMSWVQALTVGIPGLFLAAVVWLAARMAATGEITVGELVAVYGYVAILIVPVWFLLEGGYMAVRGMVGARRMINVLRIEPDEVGSTGQEPGPKANSELHDPQSGLTVQPARMIGVACDDPGEAVAIADRLGRFSADPAEQTATWGGLPITSIDLAEVRERILVADHESYLFAGTLREILTGTGGPQMDGQQIRVLSRIKAQDSTQNPDPAPKQAEGAIARAVHTASADDVVESLQDGLAEPIDSRGRNLSGGQRQRVRLARALLAEPEVLILIDPTSAVDSHTEARIAARLRDHREGRTTVVFATSPLLLAGTDEVTYIAQKKVVACGRHEDLLHQESGYRALVARDSEDETTGAAR